MSNEDKQLLLPLPINTNRNVFVVSNDLIFARKETSLSHNAIKTMDWLMTQIKKTDDDFRSYKVTTAEFGKLMGISPNNIAREMANVALELTKHVCFIPKENGGWILCSLTSSAEYTPSPRNGGVLELKISEKLRPYLLKLGNNFSKMEQTLLLTFKKKPSNELYKIFIAILKRQDIQQKELDLDNLKSVLGLAEVTSGGLIKSTSYSRFVDFKRRVLAPALDEINKVGDILVSYKISKRTLRKPSALTFTIKSKAFDKKLRKIYDQQYGELPFSGEIAEKAFEGWLENLTIEEMKALVMVKTT